MYFLLLMHLLFSSQGVGGSEHATAKSLPAGHKLQGIGECCEISFQDDGPCFWCMAVVIMNSSRDRLVIGVRSQGSRGWVSLQTYIAQHGNILFMYTIRSILMVVRFLLEIHAA